MRRYRLHPSKRPVNSMNVAEIARMIGKPHWWVWRKLRDLRIPSFKYYGQVWVVKQDVQQFLRILMNLEVKSYSTNLSPSAERNQTRDMVSGNKDR